MKKLLFTLMFLCSMTAGAQNMSNPGEPYDYYCEVYKSDFDLGVIVFAEGAYVFIDESIEKRDKRIRFNSDSGLLTFMSKRGWKYVESFMVNNRLRYVMKKQVLNDRESKQFFVLGEHPSGKIIKED